MTVRVYVPSSLRRLEALVTGTAAGVVAGSGDLTAYAVTAAARAGRPEADDEELEYLAMATAALDSVELLDGHEPQRRLVLAVDVAAVEPLPAEEPFGVHVAGFRWPDDVAAYLLDAPDAEPAVTAAALAWREKRAGWEGLVEATAAYDLGWYAPTEVPELMGLLGRPPQR